MDGNFLRAVIFVPTATRKKVARNEFVRPNFVNDHSPGKVQVIVVPTFSFDSTENPLPMTLARCCMISSPWAGERVRETAEGATRAGDVAKPRGDWSGLRPGHTQDSDNRCRLLASRPVSPPGDGVIAWMSRPLHLSKFLVGRQFAQSEQVLAVPAHVHFRLIL